MIAAISGYTAGQTQNPTYEEVSSGQTGHIEAVEVEYDPAITSYNKLLDFFWTTIDPTVENRQFCDRGNQYRSAIFYTTPEQKQYATKSKQRVKQILKTNIATEIIKKGIFYKAEAKHQDYYKKNNIRYKYYRSRCGRDARLIEIWKSKAMKSISN